MRRSAAFGIALVLLATGCQGGTKNAAPTTAPPTTPSETATTAPATTPPPTTAPPTGSATPTAGPTAGPATGPAPAKFRPIDFSFVGANSGWALGEACTATACPVVVARTTDSGHTWHQAPAPDGYTTEGDAGPRLVRNIRFGNLSNGWLWGPVLAATHDGGATWKAVTLPGQAVVNLEESGGTVWAVTRACTQNACTFDLWNAPQDSDAFVRRARLPYTGTDYLQLVRYSASFAWLVLRGEGKGRIWRTTDAGRTWGEVPDPCGTAFDYAPTQVLSRIDAANLWLLCGGDSGAGSQPKVVFHSTDGGRHWGSRNDAPLRGLAMDLVALGTQTALLSTSHSGLLRTVNGGISWAVVAPDCCDQGFGKIESIDLQHAWATGPPNAIWYTADRGAHWGRFGFHT
jgi:photosystem II stability/assembly factor-like uncharacterized protein